MIRTKFAGHYHTIATATSASVELDCNVWVPQPIAIHTGAVHPEKLCPGCDKVRMQAVEYFAVQAERGERKWDE